MRRFVPFLMLSLAACSSATPTPDDPDAEPADPDANVAEPRPDAEVQQLSRVYAHSGTNLYRIDTDNLDVVPIGPFGAAVGTASITDIAVDKDGAMIGISLGKIFDIDPETGTASLKADFGAGGGFTSLSYVPVDPSAPNSAERLVAADDQGAVFEIDPADGTATRIGAYGTTTDGDVIRSSGDIVSVRGVGTLATVTIGALTAPDYLAWIDTTTWAATPIGTASTGYDKIFGLGYWGGTVFGFVDNAPGSQSGSLVTIELDTGVATPATTSPFRWYGAGVTTRAPIID